MGTNPVASGYSTTKAGKAIVVERTKKLIADSQLIISVPSGGISKEQIDELRKLMPKTSKCSTVKNTLMNVALQGSEFEALGESLKRENMFFFIPEGEAKVSLTLNFSILLVSCVMWSAALDSSGVLLS